MIPETAIRLPFDPVRRKAVEVELQRSGVSLGRANCCTPHGGSPVAMSATRRHSSAAKCGSRTKLRNWSRCWRAAARKHLRLLRRSRRKDRVLAETKS